MEMVMGHPAMEDMDLPMGQMDMVVPNTVHIRPGILRGIGWKKLHSSTFLAMGPDTGADMAAADMGDMVHHHTANNTAHLHMEG
jgi:hypothetical protein